jgi:outer membrane protein assembly factor BamB
MNPQRRRFLIGFGLLSAGLFVFLGFGAYPVQSLRGEPAGGRLSNFHSKKIKHVAPAGDAEPAIAPKPQTAAGDERQQLAPPVAAPVQRALASTASSAGLVINATFDSSITNNANAQAIEATINQAIAIYESLFSDPIVVSIFFRYSTTEPDGTVLPTGAVAQSEFVVYDIPWNPYLTALKSDAKTANDSTAALSLPFSSLSINALPSSANGRAIGLNTPPALSANGSVGSGFPYDGIVTLNSGQSFQFTRPTGANKFDALRAIEHEIDEVLGLGSFINQGGSDLRPQDLFSWSSMGNRNFSASGSRYLSIDSGNTNIIGFNQNGNGDFGDWLSASCPQVTPYVQNAFGCKGQSFDISATSPEGINLDVIGYDLVAAASAPSAPAAHSATSVSSSAFTANWGSVAGANGYRLDVSTNSSFSSFVSGYNNLDVGNVASAGVSGLSLNVTYYYRVRAYNVTGTSGNSNTVSATTTASTPTPTPTVAPASDVAVAWQNNAVHDGNNPASSLVPPLTFKWKHDFTFAGVTSISYPLIAQGLIIVTTAGSNGKSLTAFNETTGQQVWSVNITGTYGFANAAYDSGKVFVVNFDGLMQAFNASTGQQLWSISLPGQYAFTSPPTALNGIVFVGGAGSGGTLYAVSENSGSVLWTASVENGDHSSPAVTGSSVFVSYACPQSYAFAPTTGNLQWHYIGPCEGGGGKTPVFHLGNVYVRDSFFGATNGLILNGNTGASAGGFNSDTPPAFIGNLGLYLQTGTLRGIDISTGQVQWSFAGDGGLQTVPLIVNQTIYIGSSSGLLYALDFNGNQVWSTQVGAPIPAADEQNATLTTGLGSGDGLIVVPTASKLFVYGGPNSSPTPTPTATPTPAPTPTPTPGPDTSVTWQNNVVHDGNDSGSTLTPPLEVKWQHDFASAGVQSTSYPLIAQGLVILTTAGSSTSLTALNEATGQQIWSAPITGTFGTANAAYDAGKVFVVNYDGLMQSFDAATGKPGWSVKLPFQYAFTSPPTAVNGTIFVGGAGSGGTLYAVNESNGVVRWTAPVENGDSSSPAVASGVVFVSYACPQAYAFMISTGQQLWRYTGPCEGGGGSTPVVHFGNVYVRDVFDLPTNGLILDAGTGAGLAGFSSDTPPAFVGNLGVYLQNTTLSGVDISTGMVQWTFTGDGGLNSTPIIVNHTIYVGSNSGLLYGLDFNGNQVWNTQVGAPIPRSGEGGGRLTGLGAGDNLLIVPAGHLVTAYGGPGGPTPTPTPTPTPSATPSATPAPTATPTPTPTPTPTATPTSNYTIAVSALPSAGGGANGGGSYSAGANVTVTAVPSGGFNFANWTENGSIVSTSATYQFTADSDRTLIANFVAYPTVSLSASPATVGRRGFASFTVTGTTINPSQPTVVTYTVGGNAILNVDYLLNDVPNQITIPPGQSSGSITLSAITPETRRSEKATLTIGSGPNYNLSVSPRKNRKSNPNQATVTISNR